MRRNLDEIVRRAQARGVRVLLAGMEVPTNLGPDYAAAFRDAFRAIARERGVPLLPFLDLVRLLMPRGEEGLSAGEIGRLSRVRLA